LELWDEISAARQQGDWWVIAALLTPLREAMKTGGRAANWQPADPKAAVKAIQMHYDATLRDWVGKGLDPALDRRVAEALPALRTLLAEAGAAYRRKKEERQALDYDDLEHQALALLRGNAAVRRRWQQEIHAVLVDEFQDTNALQRDLMALLGESGGKLFIVGDAKQSIYRFRGADVAVFRRERQRIEQGGGAAFSLEISYRAHRALVVGLNDLLRPVLGDNADPGRPWVEPFAPLRPEREEPGPGFVAPHIELLLAVGPKSDGALVRAASALAGRIRDLVEGGAQVVEGGRTRALEYGDVAILCRASSSFPPYEDALEQAGVPFLTVAGRGFYGRPEIRDLLNSLRALADPTDDLALAGLLRSPALALSDGALYRLCQQRDRIGGACSLWQTLGRSGELLARADEERARRAASLVGRLHEQVGRSPVADVLKAFLDATGYRAALIEAGLLRAARNVTKLLADAHASGIVGVGEFLEYLATLRDTGAREGEARSIAEGAVQIMTVHAAKGLEFPVVVLGDATWAGGGAGGVLVDPHLGLLLPLKNEQGYGAAIYRVGLQRSNDQEAAEADRLLYVAATRARETLIVSGCAGLSKDKAFGKAGGWLGRLAGDDVLGLEGTTLEYNETGSKAIRLELKVGASPACCTVYEPGYATRPSAQAAGWADEPEAGAPPRWLDPLSSPIGELLGAESERDRATPQRVWQVVPAAQTPRAPAWVIGSLVHEALAAWRFPETTSDSRFERWAGARARSYGLTDPKQLSDAVRRTQQLLLRFRGHPLHREIDHADRRLHEVPYSVTVDGDVQSGLVDLLCQSRGRWTVVEFKTDRVRDRTEFERLLAHEDYVAQARRYLAAAERLLGQRPRGVLCMLDLAGGVHAHPLEPDASAGK
jgi:ATP-dependent helicase/nuclease subunit A